MPSPKEMTLDELNACLPTRLRTRHYRTNGAVDRTVYWLDLRSAEWGRIGTVVLHDPSDPGWPDRGQTTDHEGTARSWIRERYAAWVHRRLQGEDTDLTVADAIEPFIAAMHADPDLGPDHGTVSARRSYLRVHIAPKLGRYRLATLPRDAVQQWIDEMEVTHTRHGVRQTTPASRATREGALATLRALYRHHYPGQPVPFAGVRIDLAKREAAYRRELIKAGRGRELIKKRTYTPHEMLLLLAAARFADRHPEVGVIADWACRNAAPSIALQLAFGSRIAELVEIREGDVDEGEGFVLIPGTKSRAAIRYLPLQDSARPWLAELRATKRGPARPEHYLLRTHPDRDALPSKDIYARRMARVQTLAGLKLEGERSHIFRRTHASWAHAKGIPPHEIKIFLGHSGVFGGATDDYIEMIKQMTRPEHRTYLAIPSPQEVDEFLASGWVPPGARKRRGGDASPPK